MNPAISSSDRDQAVIPTRSSSGGDSLNEIHRGQPDAEAVQAQMNRAIASAIASAAVLAVVEAHASADRAALLARAHAQQAATELRQQQKEVEVQETAVAHVRARIAAMQVVRHWKAWRQSPAWSKRAVAATTIQAHTRGVLVRRNLPNLHHRVSCVKQVCGKGFLYGIMFSWAFICSASVWHIVGSSVMSLACM